MEAIVVLIGAYLLGAVPFGYLIARSLGIDVTRVGSGNIGATNVMRAAGTTVGMTVFVLDVLKGLIPALVAHQMVLRPDSLATQQEFAFIVGMAAVLGHCVSPFLGFKGGKGVATGLGAMLGATPLVAASVFGVFLVLLAVTRYVSLASMVAALGMPMFGWFYRDPPVLIWAYGAFTLLILIRHRANIKRLLNGTEARFSLRSPQVSEPKAARPSSCREDGNADDDESRGGNG